MVLESRARPTYYCLAGCIRALAIVPVAAPLLLEGSCIFPIMITAAAVEASSGNYLDGGHLLNFDILITYVFWNTYSSLQAFAIQFGIFSGFSYVSSLFFYYAITVGLRWPKRQILKYAEPFIHICPIAIGLGMSIPPWPMHLYNPSTLGGWCTLVPTGCNFETRECIRGKIDDANRFFFLSSFLVAGMFFTMFLSFALIVWRAYIVKHNITRIMSIHGSLEFWGDKVIVDNKTNFRQLLNQILSYTIPLVLAVVFQIIEMIITGPNSYQRPSTVNALRIFFFPLQG